MPAPLNHLAKWFIKFFANGGGRKRRPLVKRQQPRVRLGMDILLEDRIAPAVLAQNDFAATLPSSPVTVAVLANDSGTQLAVVNVTQGADGTVGINSENSVTFIPNAGATGLQTVEYTVSDGSTEATATLKLYVARSAYDAYLWKVAQADLQYHDTVLPAGSIHQSNIAAAESVAGLAANQVNANYLALVAQAQQDYNATMAALGATLEGVRQSVNAELAAATSEALAAYQTALADAQAEHDQTVNAADQAYQQAIAQAQADYDAVVNPLQEALAQASAVDQANQAAYVASQADLDATTLAAAIVRDQAVVVAQATLAVREQEYATALADADSTYAAALAPVQAGRDVSWQDYQANPGDPAAQSAYDYAEALLAQTILTGGSIRDVAYAAALGTWQDAQAAATGALQAADADYAAALAPAQAVRATGLADCQASQAIVAARQDALQAAMTNAGAVQDAAEATALATYEAAEQTAEETLATAQAAASQEYQASLQAARDHVRAVVASAYALYLAQAAAAHNAASAAAAAAWNTGQNALTQIQAEFSSQTATAHAQYSAILALALIEWQGDELAAWTSYETTLANDPESAAPEARISAPAALAVAPDASDSGTDFTTRLALLGIIAVVLLVIVIVAALGSVVYNLFWKQPPLNLVAPANRVPPPFPAVGAAIPIANFPVPAGGNPEYPWFTAPSRTSQLNSLGSLGVTPIPAASLVNVAPGQPGLLNDANGVQGLNSRWLAPGGLLPGQFAGTGGCQPSIGLIITSPTMGTAIFHFGGTNGDIAVTLSQYAWPADAHAAICGGDGTPGSNDTLQTVVRTLQALSIAIDGLADTGNIWIGSDSRWYYDDRAANNNLPGQVRTPIIIPL